MRIAQGEGSTEDKRSLSMKQLSILSLSIVLVVLALPIQSSIAGDKPFPKIVPALTGSPPEGFAIGKGTTAYNGAVDGSIYKVDLQSGQGEVLVDVVEPWTPDTCRLLGMRVDLRTNYLFAAGCFYGNALVYDADTGALIMEYQLNATGDTQGRVGVLHVRANGRFPDAEVRFALS